MSHTKGPWSRNIKPARKYPTVFAGRNTHIAVMQSQGLTDEEVEANCNLVAAAPELLGLVQMAERCLAEGPKVDPIVAMATLEKLRGMLERLATR